MSADPASKVVSLYLPERPDVEAIAVAETAARGKPVSTGKVLREMIQQGIAAYWKKKGRPAEPPKVERKRRRRPPE